MFALFNFQAFLPPVTAPGPEDLAGGAAHSTWHGAVCLWQGRGEQLVLSGVETLQYLL